MKNTLTIVIILFLLSIIVLKELFNPSFHYSKADTIRIIKIIPGDSIPYAVEIKTKVPVPVYRDTGSTHWRNLPIDTMAILEDYFAKYFYNDTLMDDSSAYIQLMAHTWQNRLYYDSLLFQNRRVKAINTTIINPVPQEKLKVYIGGGTGIGSTRLSFTGDLLFIPPKGYALSGGYDFLNREVMVKAYIPVRLFRRRDPY